MSQVFSGIVLMLTICEHYSTYQTSNMPRGGPRKLVKQFIEEIPEEKLSGFHRDKHDVFEDRDFVLHMKGVRAINRRDLSQESTDSSNFQLTTPQNGEQFFILQIKVSEHTTLSTFTNHPGTVVGRALVPTDGSWSASQLREQLLKPVE